MLTHLKRVVCLLGKWALAFHGHDESVSPTNGGNYVKVLKLLARYDADLKTHDLNSDVFRGMTPEILNDLVTSVSESMMSKITSL